jgi:hypothetical protein
MNQIDCEWTLEAFQISYRNDAGEVRKLGVDGYCKNGFAIHQAVFPSEPPDSYVVTSLHTGFACFRAPNLAKAMYIADYLIEFYAADFEKLRPNCEFAYDTKPLARKLQRDENFLNILRQNSYSRAELVEAGVASDGAQLEW